MHRVYEQKFESIYSLKKQKNIGRRDKTTQIVNVSTLISDALICSITLEVIQFYLTSL